MDIAKHAPGFPWRKFIDAPGTTGCAAIVSSINGRACNCRQNNTPRALAWLAANVGFDPRSALIDQSK